MSSKTTRFLAGALFLLLLAGLIFLKGVQSGENHDEQQFVAPPVLIARDGLVPYRDFALLHMPNLVYAYALFDQMTTWHFLAARLFSAACSWGIVALVYFSCHRLLRVYSPWRRFALAAGFALLLVCSNLWLRAAARTWNHDSALLLVLGAFVAFVVAAGRKKPGGWFLLCGLLVGLALGVRLTFAPAVAPFGLGILLLPQRTWRQRLTGAAIFSLGVTVAVLPAIYFLCAHTDQFIYGNLESQRLRLLDPTDERAHKTVAVWRKYRFFAKEIMLEDIPLFLGFLVIGIPGLFRHFRDYFRKANEAGTRTLWSGALLLALLLPFLLAGAMAPTRYQSQHYYALAPFLVIGTCFGLTKARNSRHWRTILAGLLFIAAIALGSREMQKVATPEPIEKWTTVKAHRIGEKIAELAGSGKVLTLAPIYPLEGGARIYPELAVGPFAYRLAHLMPREKRARMRVIAGEDLEAFLADDPPAAILLGVERREIEAALRDYARTHKYRSVIKFGKLSVWLPPE